MERSGLHTGVAPGLGVVQTSVHNTGLAQVLALADGVVHQRGIDLGLGLPGRDAHLRMHHDKAAGQVAVFGRGDAAHHFYPVNIIGSYLAKVGSGKGGLRERTLTDGTVVRHGYAIDHDARAEGRCLVVRQLAQLYVRGRGQVVVAHELPGHQLHDVGQRRGLQVVDGLTANDARRRRARYILAGGDAHLLQRERGFFQLYPHLQVLAVHAQVDVACLKAHVAHLQRVLAIGYSRQRHLALHVGQAA